MLTRLSEKVVITAFMLFGMAIVIAAKMTEWQEIRNGIHTKISPRG